MSIKQHFAAIDAEHRESLAAAAETQRKINNPDAPMGGLLDLDHEAARSGVDLSGKSPEQMIHDLVNQSEIRDIENRTQGERCARATCPGSGPLCDQCTWPKIVATPATSSQYLGDSVESLTNANRRAKSHRGSRAGGASKPHRRLCPICKTPISSTTKTGLCRIHSDEQRIKEAEPRGKMLTARCTPKTDARLQSLLSRKNINLADFLMISGRIEAALCNENAAAKAWDEILDTFMRERELGILNASEQKRLSVTLKGQPPATA